MTSAMSTLRSNQSELTARFDCIIPQKNILASLLSQKSPPQASRTTAKMLADQDSEAREHG